MTTIIKRTENKVIVKKRKNGDFYANISKIEKPLNIKVVSKSASAAKGKNYKSITIISIWDIRPCCSSVKVIWNESFAP